MLWCKEKYHVYITRNTYRGMLLEAGRHPGKESIIQMPVSVLATIFTLMW